MKKMKMTKKTWSGLLLVCSSHHHTKNEKKRKPTAPDHIKPDQTTSDQSPQSFLSPKSQRVIRGGKGSHDDELEEKKEKESSSHAFDPSRWDE